jgi:hypothetical protein
MYTHLTIQGGLKMNNYANPSFPANPTANVSPSNAAPLSTPYNNAPAYTAPMANIAALPTAGYPAAGCHPVAGHGGVYTTTGVILVLFILLVIINRLWGV